MRRSKLILGAAVAAIACASGAAHAARVGVFIGGGMPYYYPVAPAPYYWGPPPPVIVAPPPEAPDYVEQGQPQAAAGNYAQGPADAAGSSENGDTWYYCDASKTYYPYVKQCSSGWRAVPAEPAPSN
ncbi:MULTISPECIES: hypothetical protein [unclassified Paraburkholderia]|uniref:hypothetical protein n=1 Tax=unclassified Paraburkholderia TaxID=2615204 RepID=UPI001980D7A6|nr:MULTISPECIES: hypothetical protein [unclassified Paraburkholderia]MBN3856536.1 hypothetical protein [Paraburkholderia sp. Ac-20340]